MAPIRRYLRITQYSVLECRIYLDNPALAESWLLNSRNPILPRVIESVRPLVLPKLREENERQKAKGGKKKGVRDIVVEEDFEVSIFLTETSTRHSILTKQKRFREPNKKNMQSNSQKLLGDTNDTAIEVEDVPTAVDTEDMPQMVREESETDGANLLDIPTVEEDFSDSDSLFVEDAESPRRSKRGRAPANTEDLTEIPDLEPLSKRSRIEEADDDKKKMAMDTFYDGFSIYGRVLCLVVKRKDKKGKGSAVTGGQAMMEDWIASTQMPADEEEG